MGLTKTDLFTERQNQLAKWAKVMGHPARIAIIDFLLNAKACINGDLVDELGLAQATISQHLRELKEVGLIQGTIEGTRVNYCIHTENWSAMSDAFHELFVHSPSDKNRQCC
jgi:ArsR family transcriptional regulator, zinc-responsive transcriptional repressor